MAAVDDIIIRQLKEDDWRLLRDIRLKALRTDPAVFGSNFSLESVKSELEWRDQLKAGNTATFGVFAGECIIGMTGIAIRRDDPTHKTSVLWGSWLEPEWRGRGLSKLFYKARIDWAERHPTCEKIIVSHRLSNISSKNANQKHGFLFTHEQPKTWPDGKTESECFYELSVKLSLRPNSEQKLSETKKNNLQ